MRPPLPAADIVAALAGTYAEHLTIDPANRSSGAPVRRQYGLEHGHRPRQHEQPGRHDHRLRGRRKSPLPLTVQHVYIGGDIDGVYFNSAVSHVALSDVTLAATSIGVEVRRRRRRSPRISTWMA